MNGLTDIRRVLPLSLFQKMNTFAYQRFYPSAAAVAVAEPEIDWLTCSWGGPYLNEEGDEAPAPCGSWACPGNCSICIIAEKIQQSLYLPVYGPVNRDGISLGFLLVIE